jgi:tRNA-Thr(GGU) m(6)t(6)A37 methyltransferase TsaA
MEKQSQHIDLAPIGMIRTPYVESAPYQPIEGDQGDFRIEVFAPYQEGLLQLDRFQYIYVMHKSTSAPSLLVDPPWTTDTTVGVFASRSPRRPNRVGLSVVRLKRIEGNLIHTSGLDVFDKTPLLDIKPYIQDLDVKTDANYGWLESIADRGHLMLHIKGIPHDY